MTWPSFLRIIMSKKQNDTKKIQSVIVSIQNPQKNKITEIAGDIHGFWKSEWVRERHPEAPGGDRHVLYLDCSNVNTSVLVVTL